MLVGTVLLSTFIGQTTIGRAAFYERSARRRKLYLTIHNRHQRQISMPPEGFESTIPARKRLHTQALEPAATGNGAISFSRTARFTLSLSPERFNYSTNILCIPQTFSNINWSDPEYEQPNCCQAILLFPILLVTSLILHLKGNDIKWIRIV